MMITSEASQNPGYPPPGSHLWLIEVHAVDARKKRGKAYVDGRTYTVREDDVDYASSNSPNGQIGDSRDY
jgi:hypothetical protein